MLPTHAVVGLAVATPLLGVAPEFAPAALLGGLLGGIFPDLDLYSGHRKTLHYPTGYAVAALPAVGAAALFPVAATVGLAWFFVGAVAHCRMDRYGGGLELEPWEETSERAVYDHARGEWREPKRWVRYDGSPRDLLLLTAVAVPLFLTVGWPFRGDVVLTCESSARSLECLAVSTGLVVFVLRLRRPWKNSCISS